MKIWSLTNFSEFRQKVCHDCDMRQERMKQTGKFLRRLTGYALPSMVAVVLLFSLPAAKKVRVSNAVNTLVIDAGHGGLDPGCNGNNEVFEKDVTLGVALKLGKLLKDSLPSLKVLYTRTTDKSLKLWERPNLANDRQADLFISIH